MRYRKWLGCVGVSVGVLAACSSSSNGPAASGTGPAADGGGAGTDGSSGGTGPDGGGASANACAPAKVTLPPWVKADTSANKGSLLTDVNGDGKLDIVTDGPAVLLGNGDGTFQASKSFDQGLHEGLDFIAVGDVTKDGKPDIVGISQEAQLYVFPNQGNGDFTNLAGPQKYDLGLNAGPFQASGLLAVDMNKDGALDVIWASTNSKNVFVILNDGTGKFTAAPKMTELSQLPSIRNLVTADFNHDGNADVAITTNGQGTDSAQLSVFFGDGAGNLTKSADYPLGEDSSGFLPLTVADLDGNGAPDLATSNDKSNLVVAFKNDGSGKFTGGNAPISFPTDDGGANAANEASGITAGDFNGDGKGDLALVTSDHDFAITVFYGNGDGTFQGTNYPNPSFPTGLPRPNEIHAGDFNGDGLSDIEMLGQSPDPNVGSAAWLAITGCAR